MNELQTCMQYECVYHRIYIEMNNIPSRPSSKLLILVIMFVFVSVVCLGMQLFVVRVTYMKVMSTNEF